jgi:hypothetical protein
MDLAFIASTPAIHILRGVVVTHSGERPTGIVTTLKIVDKIRKIKSIITDKFGAVLSKSQANQGLQIDLQLK